MEFLVAAQRGDSTTTHALLSTDLLAELPRGKGPGFLRILYEELPSAEPVRETLTVVDVMTEDYGAAKVAVGSRQHAEVTLDITLLQEDEGWRVLHVGPPGELDL